MAYPNSALTHTMPDGSIMPGRTHQDAPALQMGSNTLSGIPYNQGQPVLMDPNQPNNPRPALQTGNARGSYRMPNSMDPQKINMMGEGMIRMGSAMGSQTANGLNAGMAAAGQEYGNIMDYNRQAEAEAQALEEARRVELQRRMDAQASASQAGANKPDTKLTGENAVAAAKYRTAMAVLQGFDDHDGVVGLGSYLKRPWDQITGNERENIRLKIASLRVDNTLSYVAQTKGAISEKEMAIFSSAQPRWIDGEDIWRTWVQDYAEAIRVMNVNMNGGSVTGTYSDGTTSNFGPGQTPTPGDFSFVD